mmetsp:Transcript_64733/g.179516  ORF Transcript_64733/g.179516 Transcript_64733/m.179516 type:complete len:362 (+) Transcript_64733:114-1199(+)
MAASARFAALSCLFLLPSPAGAAKAGVKISLLARAARVQTSLGLALQGLPDDATQRTLLALDSDRDGRISPREVAAFAVSQGMEAVSASQEFASLDTNGDGTLDSTELAGALGSPAGGTPAVAASAPAMAYMQPIAVASPALAFLPQAATASAPAVAYTQQPDPLVATVGLQSQAAVGPAAPPAALPEAETHGFMRRALALRRHLPEAPAANVLLPGTSVSVNNAGAAVGAGEAAPAAAIATGAGAGAAARQQTTRDVAKSIVEQLTLEERAEAEAQALERKAAELRANSTTIVRLTLQRAEKASERSASQKASELLDRLTKLEKEATKDEVEAASMRAQTRGDLLQVDDVMGVADEALKQ